MTENGYSLADIAAASGNNRNGSMAGDWAWIIILLLFGWGNENGNGPFGNRGNGNNGGGANGYTLATDFSNIERKLDGINNGICDSTYALTNNINGNFRTLDGNSKKRSSRGKCSAYTSSTGIQRSNGHFPGTAQIPNGA